MVSNISSISAQQVDWKKFAELENYRSGTFSQTIYRKEVEKLINLGILSLEPNNNFSIQSDEGVVLSPTDSTGLLHLYFTKRDDAESYAKLNFGNAQYRVHIFKIANLKTINED